MTIWHFTDPLNRGIMALSAYVWPELRLKYDKLLFAYPSLDLI